MSSALDLGCPPPPSSSAKKLDLELLWDSEGSTSYNLREYKRIIMIIKIGYIKMHEAGHSIYIKKAGVHIVHFDQLPFVVIIGIIY